MPDDYAFANKPAYTGGYHIVDRHTKQIVGQAKTLRGALRSVDRRDNAYGAYRYTHRKIEDDNGQG